ncbi:MAG: hypothetical protein WD358_07790 [Nitriliruptoraceae bacterium]
MNRLRLRTLTSITAIVMIAIVGCSPTDDLVVAPLPDDLDSPSASPVIAVIDNAYEPEAVVITAGTTVTWEWQGRAAHDVVGPRFDSGIMIAGSFQQTFTEVGSHPYVCSLHPGMVGVAHVIEAVS